MRRGLYGRTQELEWLNMLVGDPGCIKVVDTFREGS